MNKQVIVTKGRPFFCRMDNGVTFFKFFELQQDIEFILFSKSGKKVQKRFGADRFPKNLTFTENPEFYDPEKWADKLRGLDGFLAKYPEASHLHLQGDIKTFYRHGNEEEGVKFLKKSMSQDKIHPFVSMKNSIDIFIPPLLMSEKRKTTHLIHDPQEAQICNNNWFFYENARIGAKYVPYVEYGLFRDAVNIYRDPSQKEKLFTFGFVVICESRIAIYDEITKLNQQNLGFYVRYPKKGIDTSLMKREYDEEIRKSKFTLVIPSYEATDFSSIRFWDALFRGCIPLIHETCQWRQAFVEFPQFVPLIEKYLVTSTEDIRKKLEQDNMEIYREFSSTDDWKKLSDLDWYRMKSRDFFESL